MNEKSKVYKKLNGETLYSQIFMVFLYFEGGTFTRMNVEEIRVFPGKNIYSHCPCIKITLNLLNWAGVFTSQVPFFNEEIVKKLPGLKEHCCSRGKPGGFLERLKEGTYFGHVIEHAAIELQRQAGYNINYGKTLGTDNPKVYEIIFNYEIKQVGIAAGYLAVDLVSSILEKRNFNQKQKIIELKETAKKYDYGPSTKAIIKAAKKRKIPVIPLKEGTSLIQLGTGKYQKRIQATLSSQTRCLAVDISGDKEICKALLLDAGIPVAPGAAVNTIGEALKAVQNIGYPLVVKPDNGNHGKGVSLNIKSKQELIEAFREAKEFSSKVILEKHIKGRNYRLLVVGGRLAAAAERIPPFILGEGKLTIKELIDRLNSDPLRGQGHENYLTKVKIDSHVLKVLKKQGYNNLKKVPSKGELVWLRENDNLSTGAVAKDVTDLVHPDNIYLAERIARILDLDIAGIDLIAENIVEPVNNGRGAVIEVNAAPGIRMHEHPTRGKARDTAGKIINMLFPPGEKTKVPIISITGTNGKTTVTRMMAHLLRRKGLVTGMTTTDGIFINERCVMNGDTTGPISAQIVLKDPTVDAAVLETARGGIIKGGLGYDLSDIAIITNVSYDHLGQDGINDLEDLLYVKSLVAEAVDPKGYVVLNADDCNVARLSRWVRAKIIYFSKKDNNLIMKKHLAQGGKGVFIKGKSIFLAEGQRTQFLIKVQDVPVTLKGKARHHTENALAVTAAGTAFGLSPKEIVEGLRTFTLSLSDNPGRGNIFNYGYFKVIVDYGHNEAGFLSVAQMARKIGASRLVGIIGVPGDRSNQLIKKAGTAAGKYFDRIYIKEDQSLRGRKRGEVAAILKKGIKETKRDIDIEIIYNEREALADAVKRAEPGDLIVMFYEKIVPILELLDNIKQKPSFCQKAVAGKAI